VVLPKTILAHHDDVIKAVESMLPSKSDISAEISSLQWQKYEIDNSLQMKIV